MYADGVYRFNLSFRATSKEAQEVGDFLESLKSRKSRVIVDAVHEYLLNHHDELLNKELNITYNPVAAQITPEMFADILSDMLDEKLKALKFTAAATDTESSESEELDSDLMAFLDNNDDFV